MQGYDLGVMPGGPKLGSPVQQADRPIPFAESRGADGFMHCDFKQTSMALLANRLGLVLLAGQRHIPGRPPDFPRVNDRTGVAGRFNFELDFPAPSIPGLPGNGTSVEPEDIPSLVAEALAKQLGLKLTPAKIALDLVIVDHAERVPSAN